MDPPMQRSMPRFDKDFIALAHRHQEPPLLGNGGGPWTTWLMLGGRGAGKTRLGAEWVRAQANGIAPYADQRALHIALVGETEHDVREVMIEGPAGLLHVSPRGERPTWVASRAGGWNGQTAPSALRFPRRIPSSCAGRNSTPPGATSSPSGTMSMRPSTCCNSVCGWGSARASSSPPRRGRFR